MPSNIPDIRSHIDNVSLQLRAPYQDPLPFRRHVYFTAYPCIWNGPDSQLIRYLIFLLDIPRTPIVQENKLFHCYLLI